MKETCTFFISLCYSTIERHNGKLGQIKWSKECDKVIFRDVFDVQFLDGSEE